MDKKEYLLEALDAIDPARLSYTEWLDVGNALKNEGYSVEVWDTWSRRDPNRYEQGTCYAKWGSIDSSVNGGLITNYAKMQGYVPPSQRPRTQISKYAGTTAEVPVVEEHTAGYNELLEVQNKVNNGELVPHYEVAGKKAIEEYNTQEKKLDFTKGVLKAHDALINPQTEEAHSWLVYLTEKRGISLDQIKKYKIGFYANGWNSFLKESEEAGNATTAHRLDSEEKGKHYKLILPYINGAGAFNYAIGEVEDRTLLDSKGKPLHKYQKVNKVPFMDRSWNNKDSHPVNKAEELNAELFNERYIKQEEAPAVVFLCEGVYDALSIEEAGASAVAFVGVGHARLLSLVKHYRPKCSFIVCLDNDATGNAGAERTLEGLKALGYKAELKQIAKPCKDANELLNTNKKQLLANVKEAIEAVTTKAEGQEETKEEYLARSANNHLQAFIDSVKASGLVGLIKTGFNELDEVLGQGLRAGTYFLGANSSLGKTTFCLQIADSIAKAGHDVLIFSLEMAEEELIAKSVSRLTLLLDLEQYNSTADASTTLEILNGKFYSRYSERKFNLIKEAISRYSEYSSRIWITESVGATTVKQIEAEVKKHIEFTGNIPVVLIDYLQQIEAPKGMESASDKQITDKNVKYLKQLSRDTKTAIIGISSFNRESYTEPVSMRSFKESGAVEYSSDTLIGLQLEGMEYIKKTANNGKETWETDAERKTRVRQLQEEANEKGRTGQAIPIELKVLKNRNGVKGKCYFDFYPAYNYFKEREV